MADAVERLQQELDRLGASQYVLSSNMETRLDGRPRSGQAEPADTGVALYFRLNGKPHCLPCDRYDRVADNIAAIAKHIEATRAIERYGVASLSEMFTGFQSLPPPGSKPWNEVLGVGRHANKVLIDAAYKRLARERHPDVSGGSEAMMSELNAARDAAYKENGFG